MQFKDEWQLEGLAFWSRQSRLMDTLHWHGDGFCTHSPELYIMQTRYSLSADTSSFNAYCLLQRVMLYSGMIILLGKKKKLMVELPPLFEMLYTHFRFGCKLLYKL
jgi:hypothetical protein